MMEEGVEGGVFAGNDWAGKFGSFDT